MTIRLTRRFLIPLTLTLCAAAPLHVSADDAIERGLALLQDGNHQAAAELFSRQRQAADPNDSDSQADLLFYSGLVQQHQARGITDSDRRRDHLERAVRHYRQALALRPRRAGTLLNLAEAHADLGNHADAYRAYRAAIKAGGKSKGVYVLALARYYERRGKLDKARANALQAAELQPGSKQAHDTVVRLHRPDKLAQLMSYLWKQEAGGYPKRAQATALAMLGWPEAQTAIRQQALTLVAASLAHDSYAPREFATTSVGTALLALRNDPKLGAAVSQLQDLHVEPSKPFSAFGQWRPYDDRRVGLSRREAFARLAGSLGRRNDRLQRLDEAEAQYRRALDAGLHAPDPKAFLDLAQFYIDNGNDAGLADLRDRYEGRMFGGKGDAYGSKDDHSIYRYHLALGVMYAHLEEWESDRWRPASAIFQLDHARTTAQRINAVGEDPVELPTQALELLAEGYEKTGRPKQAFNVRLEAASEFLEAGKLKQAKHLIKPIEREGGVPAGIDPVTRDRYQWTVTRIKYPDRADLSPPESVQRADLQRLLNDRTQVRSLQRALKERGEAVTVDGLFGPKTKAAVRNFQAKEQLEVNGMPGYATRRALGVGR